MTTVVMSGAGWANERDVILADVTYGFGTNRSARLSGRLNASDAHLLGFASIKGAWVWLNGPCGPWGGYVEDDPVDIDAGIMELNCTDLMGTLDWAITPRTYRQYSSSPGALIGRAIRDSGQDEPLWIDRTVIDESGLPVTIEWRGENTGRVVQSIASAANGLLTVAVDADRAIILTYLTEPIDDRDEVVLVEGREIIAGSIRPSISRVVNDITGIANDRDWQRATAARVVDSASVDSVGRRRATRTYQGHTRASSIEPAATAELATLARSSGPVSLQIIESHPVLAELRVARMVSVWGASNNRIFDLVITGIAHETTQRIVTVVGTVTEQEER